MQNFDLQSPAFTGMLLLMLLWSLPWKGVALWKAARNNQRGWFIVMLVLNTFAILEITYLFFFQKRKAR